MTSSNGRWFYTREQIVNSPSRRSGINLETEINYRQLGAKLIQDMGQRLEVTQLAINTAIVYMHRFYMFHSYENFRRYKLAPAALYLACKVEENIRRSEDVVQVARALLYPEMPRLDTNPEDFLAQVNELFDNECVLLETLGFDFPVDHPHKHVVEFFQRIEQNNEVSRAVYSMATTTLHMTTFCLQYKPTLVACVCIKVTCKRMNYTIEDYSGNNWFTLVDPSITFDMIQNVTREYQTLLRRYPNIPERLRNSIPQAGPSSSRSSYTNNNSEDRQRVQHNNARQVNPIPQASPSTSRSSYTNNNSEDRQRVQHNNARQVNPIPQAGPSTSRSSYTNNNSEDRQRVQHNNAGQVNPIPQAGPSTSRSSYTNNKNNSEDRQRVQHNNARQVNPIPQAGPSTSRSSYTNNNNNSEDRQRVQHNNARQVNPIPQAGPSTSRSSYTNKNNNSEDRQRVQHNNARQVNPIPQAGPSTSRSSSTNKNNNNSKDRQTIQHNNAVQTNTRPQQVLSTNSAERGTEKRKTDTQKPSSEPMVPPPVVSTRPKTILSHKEYSERWKKELKERAEMKDKHQPPATTSTVSSHPSSSSSSSSSPMHFSPSTAGAFIHATISGITRSSSGDSSSMKAGPSTGEKNIKSEKIVESKPKGIKHEVCSKYSGKKIQSDNTSSLKAVKKENSEQSVITYKNSKPKLNESQKSKSKTIKSESENKVIKPEKNEPKVELKKEASLKDKVIKTNSVILNKNNHDRFANSQQTPINFGTTNLGKPKKLEALDIHQLHPENQDSNSVASTSAESTTLKNSNSLVSSPLKRDKSDHKHKKNERKRKHKENEENKENLEKESKEKKHKKKDKDRKEEIKTEKQSPTKEDAPTSLIKANKSISIPEFLNHESPSVASTSTESTTLKNSNSLVSSPLKSHKSDHKHKNEEKKRKQKENEEILEKESKEKKHKKKDKEKDKDRKEEIKTEKQSPKEGASTSLIKAGIIVSTSDVPETNDKNLPASIRSTPLERESRTSTAAETSVRKKTTIPKLRLQGNAPGSYVSPPRGIPPKNVYSPKYQYKIPNYSTNLIRERESRKRQRDVRQVGNTLPLSPSIPQPKRQFTENFRQNDSQYGLSYDPLPPPPNNINIHCNQPVNSQYQQPFHSNLEPSGMNVNMNNHFYNYYGQCWQIPPTPISHSSYTNINISSDPSYQYPQPQYIPQHQDSVSMPNIHVPLPHPQDAYQTYNFPPTLNYSYEYAQHFIPPAPPSDSHTGVNPPLPPGSPPKKPPTPPPE